MPARPNYIRVRRDCTGSGCVFTEEGTIGKNRVTLYWVRKPDTDPSPNQNPGKKFDFDPNKALVFPPNSPFTVTNIAPDMVTVNYTGDQDDAEWKYTINVVDRNARDVYVESDGTPVIRNH